MCWIESTKYHRLILGDIGDVQVCSKPPGTPLTFYRFHGKTLCDGLFDFYDRYGLPLADMLRVLREYSVIPALDQFIDALVDAST